MLEPVRSRFQSGCPRVGRRVEDLLVGGRSSGCGHAFSSSSWNVSAPVIAATTSSIDTSLRLEAGDARAEAQHLDPVGHLEHLRHVVADEHDREALVADLADQVEHVARLDDAERGGRLVHEDDLLGPRHRAADRDALALAAGHVRDARARVLDLHAEALERLVAAPAHLGLVEEPELAQEPGRVQLAAQEHVRGGVDLGREREVLVDRLDAEAARVLRRVDVDRLALEEDLPAVGRVDADERLDQRALAGAVVADRARRPPADRR